MNTQNFTTTLVIDRSPQEVYDAINNVRGWWSGEIEGTNETVGAEFTYTVPGVHFSRQRVTELIPAKKVVWDVVEARLSLIPNPSKWQNTTIQFDIVEKEGKTELHFSHIGLVPEHECYQDCSTAWGLLVNGNLKNLVTTGEQQPSPW